MKIFDNNCFSRNSGGRNSGRLPDRDAPPGGGTGSDRDRENFSRWRDRQYFGPRKWLETALRDNPYEKDSGSELLTLVALIDIKMFISNY